ncbi:MAG: hypothetical protein KAQ94_06100 [Arcobacteraceae bacterium]|nr:hypothetical protein [Arcobacteraceae bacterium]
MKNNFKLHQDSDYKTYIVKLTSISAKQVDEFIKDYNVYFKAFSEDVLANQVDTNIYQIDNLKDFDEQYEDIKNLMPSSSVKHISFYTNWIKNEAIQLKKVEDSCNLLKSENKSTCISSLQKHSQVSKEICEQYLKSLEHQQEGLFE